MKRTISFLDVTKFTWSYFRRFPWLVGCVYFVLSINILSEVVAPMVSGWLIDTITISDLEGVIRLRQALFFVVLLFGQGILFHVSYRIAHFLNCYIDANVEKLVATETLDRIQRFSTDWHTGTFAGANVTKVKRGMRAVHTFYDIICYDFFRTIGIAVILVILIGLRQPILGGMFGIFIVIYTAFSILMATRYVAPMNRKANIEDNRVGGALADTLSSNTTVKSFAGENRENRLFRRVACDWEKTARHSWIRGNIMALSQNIVINLLKLAVMVGAVWFWYKGSFTAGDVVFIFTSYQIFSHHLSTLGDRIRDFNQAVNDMEDIVRFAHTPLQVIDHPQAKKLEVSAGKIEIDRITFSYSNQHGPVFRDLSLSIRPGEKIALVGHSGSGKSTFVKLVQRLYDLQKGVITIDEQDISRVTQKSLRRQIALVPQEPILFHRSLMENIAYGNPKASFEEIQKAAEKAHAHEFIKDLTQGYDTLVGERGIKLSGGERQRVAIARAILADTPILILDEATSSLDSESERLIQDALKNLMKNRTAIIIAHRLSTIKAVDRILVFERGMIAEEGTHARLLRKQGGIYKQLYELQAGGFIGE